MRFAAVPLLALAFRAATADVITDIGAFESFTDDDYRQCRNFVITGRVSAANGPWFVLTDGTHFRGFDVYDAVSVPADPIRAGELVCAEGIAKLYNQIDQARSALSVRKLDAPLLPPAPPLEPTPRQILSGSLLFRNIRTSGVITAVEQDEVDPTCQWLSLSTPEGTVCCAICTARLDPRDYVDAKVTLVGTVKPSAGKRRLLRCHVIIVSRDDITVVQPPPADPFSDAPALEKLETRLPEFPLTQNRRRTDGTVTATWNDDRFFLDTDAGLPILVQTDRTCPLPAVGSRVRVVAFVATDVFFPKLVRAIFRTLDARVRPPKAAEPVDARTLFTNDRGERRFDIDRHGQAIRLQGIVRSVSDSRLALECGSWIVPVDISAQSGHAQPPLGATVDVSGICCVDLESDGLNAAFPHLTGFTLVMRTPDDLTVISRPPWWTPGRLFAVIVALLLALVGFSIWNRILNRLVERRGRALLREEIAHSSARLKVEERTRLAVELHDTIAQNLTGVSLQLDAAMSAAENEPSALIPTLTTASETLRNCRDDLRNCLWDLHNRAFEEHRLDTALLQTVKPHAGAADVEIDSDAKCAQLPDNVLHAILSIARELTANAVRHGGATCIRIRTSSGETGFEMVVSDNGRGFDPNNHPGFAEGHFGLQGVRERLRRLGGKIDISSRPGSGTTITVSLP